MIISRTKMATSFRGQVSFAGVLGTILTFVVLSADKDDYWSTKNVYGAEMWFNDSKSHFIMFFTTWCNAHCERLVPIWDDLADIYNNDISNDVFIAKVDCTDTNVCIEQGVSAYPFFKFFKQGEEPEVYKGKRDLESFEAHVQKTLEASACFQMHPDNELLPDQNGQVEDEMPEALKLLMAASLLYKNEMLDEIELRQHFLQILSTHLVSK